VNKHTVITLDPGETLEVRGSTSEYEDTALFAIFFDIEEGWATASVNELYEDNALRLSNSWELPPEASPEPL
jgi:hypothetical protein